MDPTMDPAIQKYIGNAMVWILLFPVSNTLG